MGNCCLPIRFRGSSSAINSKNVTLLLVGLDNSGKTTIAKRLAGEPIDSVVSTVGFSVITLRQKGYRVSVYDLGGGPQIRNIWPRYYADAHGVIFVVDALDVERMEECRKTLEGILENHQVSGKPILLLANKQDVEGALDEIDIVERLNLERLVNERKCPTLVELCSALQFSRRLDIGIDNGYKWLVRSIIRDYPSLNYRVLNDLAKQEEENKVKIFTKSRAIQDGEKRVIVNQTNGAVNYKNRSQKSVSKVPGLANSAGKQRDEIHKFLGEDVVSVEETPVSSFSSEFFLFENFQSDIQLLNDVPNQSIRNFLVRPKSSGARLYGIKPDKKKAARRMAFLKGNKTGPAPFTDLSNGQNPRMPKALTQPDECFDKNTPHPVDESGENVNPFAVTAQLEDRRKSGRETIPSGQLKFEPKSLPNTRKSSGDLECTKRRRYSAATSKPLNNFSNADKVQPLQLENDAITNTSTVELLLDAAQLKR